MDVWIAACLVILPSVIMTGNNEKYHPFYVKAEGIVGYINVESQIMTSTMLGQ